MKITGIEIGEYRQFKNIKFDFTYPKGHAKAGQPLDKVCFIGQSGTGKTTLLNVIWELIQEINQILRIGTIKDDGHQPDKYMAKSIFDIKYYLDIKGKLVVFDRGHEEQKLDKDFSSYWTLSDLPLTRQYKSIDTDKFCIFIKDSVAHEADAFLFDQKDQPQTFSDFVKTDTQIEKDKANREERIRKAGLKKAVSLGDMQSLATWQYLLKDIDNYDEASRTLVINLVQGAQSASASKVMEELQKWIANTPNARVDLAEKCLNPILNNFFLEVDTNAGNVPIALRTKQGTKINNSYLSTGTRQLLATSIPLYKFDTTDTVILFDEPERSLFPDIQRGLINYYTSLAPTAQFFFATHSPIIASAFEPCERFILYFDENGEVKFHNGVAPEGDDPNDILSEDFGLEELMLPKGLEEYKRYRRLAVEIRNEKDAKRKDELIVERAKLGDLYRF